MITYVITTKLINVKMLFIIEDSLTPTAKITVKIIKTDEISR